MKRVEVDFSTTVRDGLVRASLARVSDGQPLSLGDRVEAYDDDEGMSFMGVVEQCDDRFAYLRMEWEVAQPGEIKPPEWVNDLNVLIARQQGAVTLVNATAPTSRSLVAPEPTRALGNSDNLAPA